MVGNTFCILYEKVSPSGIPVIPVYISGGMSNIISVMHSRQLNTLMSTIYLEGVRIASMGDRATKYLNQSKWYTEREKRRK